MDGIKTKASRSVFRAAWLEYIKWVADPRMLILPVLMIFIYSLAIEPLTANAQVMGERLNLFEPYVAVMNSPVVILILPLTFMALTADFPRIDTNTVFIISRMGRTRWLCSQLMKLAMMAFSYLLAVFAGAVIPVMLTAEASTKWSRVVTGFAEMYPELSGNYGAGLIPKNLYYQFPVLGAAALSFLYVFLYLIIIGLVLLTFTVWKRRTAGFVLCGLTVSLGAATFAISSGLQWIFPMSNALIWVHKTTVLRQGIYPMTASVAYLIAVPVVLAVLCFFGVKRFNYDNITEVVF